MKLNYNRRHRINGVNSFYVVLLSVVESNGIKRLFMMYVEGRRQPKTVFKNEYGFDVGTLEQTVGENGNGEIEIYGNKYYYQLPQKPGGILSVFRHTNTQPLISIVTETLAVGNFTGALKSKLPLDYFYCIFMSFCWFLQLPQNKEYLKPSVAGIVNLFSCQ